MWFLRKYRPSYIYLILLSILLIIAICLRLHDEPIFELSLLFENSLFSSSSNKYLRVKLDFSSPTARCRLNDRLIIYILSTITNFQRRRIIRSTWASPLIGTCFVFILGKNPDNQSIGISIQKERQEFRDIIQINHNETYANVVYKEVGALQWSSRFYPSIPYLFKTDDDLILDSILISDLVEILTTNIVHTNSYISKYRPTLNENLISSDRLTFFRGAWSMSAQPTLRSSKFAVSENIWPYPFLPLYCSGFGWLMSKNVRNQLVQASFIYPLNKTVWVGDVFTSGFLARTANVNCTYIPIDYEQTFAGNCSCLMAQQPMLTVCSSSYHGRGNDDDTTIHDEYKKAWKVIRQRHCLDHQSTTNIVDC